MNTVQQLNNRLETEVTVIGSGFLLSGILYMIERDTLYRVKDGSNWAQFRESKVTSIIASPNNLTIYVQ